MRSQIRILQTAVSTRLRQMNQSLLSNRYLFLDYLNRRYGDPNAKARALDRLRSLKQKPDESFASFFPKFEKELADSGGGEWADVVQINYLEGAINNRLKSSLVSAVSLPKDFNSYAELL
ncbi:reverse transcriptase (RNA-dependent DNA polymerase) [Hirsutella rhossiliensis]